MIEIPGYEIIKPLGSGGMAVVYLARDGKLGREVAIKVLLENFSLDDNTRKRFFHEAKVLASLNHPNIVVLHDYLEFGNRLALVMEYIHGRTLDHVIGNEVGPITHTKALPMFRDILKGVGHAHRKGIVHRDLKPGNVMISHDNVIKVGDFGIAKIVGQKGFTRTGLQKPGTLYYMAPEALTGKEATSRSDIYALGMTLYEMLSGTMPLESEGDTSEYELMTKVIKQDLPDPREFYPHIPEPLVNVIVKATSKNPLERYANCDEMYEALKETARSSSKAAARTERVGKAVPVTSVSRNKNKKSIWRKILPIGGVAAVIAIASVLTFSPGKEEPTPAGPPPPPPEPALAIVDSIPCGPYFHDISRVTYTPDGDIVVLDGERMEVNVFNSTGDYLTGVELAEVPGGGLDRPVGFTTLPDGRLAVSDLDAGGVLLFDRDYSFDQNLDDFDYMAPWNIVMTGSGFAGAELWMDGSEAGYRVCRWDSTCELEYVLNLNLKDISTASTASRLGIYLDAPLVAASSDGCVYTALVRSGETTVHGYDPQGNSTMELVVSGIAAEKHESLKEAELRRAAFLFGLSNTGWTPDSLLPVISYMGVDSLQRLWLRRGTEDIPVFDIYSSEGEQLYTVAFNDHSLAGWDISVSETGMLAWPRDTLQRQMVYMISLENDPALAPDPMDMFAGSTQ